MMDILGIIFPIYAAIALGYGLVRFAVFSAGEMRMLSRFVLNVALPPLLFTAIASRDLSEFLLAGYLFAYAVGGLLTLVVALIWFRFAAADRARQAVAALGSVVPNSSFIGYPVMLLTFPDIAGIVLGLNVLTEMLLLIPICLILLDMSKEGDHVSITRQVGAILLGVLKRPMMIGLVLGVLVSALGLTVPLPLDRALRMLGSVAPPLSLIVIGGALVGVSLKGNRLLAGQIATAKLVLHPAMILLALAILPLTGLPALSADYHAAIVLTAAIPMFSIFPVLSQEVGRGGLASIAMLMATSAAFFTLSALLYILT